MVLSSERLDIIQRKLEQTNEGILHVLRESSSELDDTSSSSSTTLRGESNNNEIKMLNLLHESKSTITASSTATKSDHSSGPDIVDTVIKLIAEDLDVVNKLDDDDENTKKKLMDENLSEGNSPSSLKNNKSVTITSSESGEFFTKRYISHYVCLCVYDVYMYYISYCGRKGWLQRGVYVYTYIHVLYIIYCGRQGWLLDLILGSTFPYLPLLN